MAALEPPIGLCIQGGTVHRFRSPVWTLRARRPQFGGDGANICSGCLKSFRRCLCRHGRRGGLASTLQASWWDSKAATPATLHLPDIEACRAKGFVGYSESWQSKLRFHARGLALHATCTWDGHVHCSILRDYPIVGALLVRAHAATFSYPDLPVHRMIYATNSTATTIPQ